jgi:hypothetical protein
MAGFEVLGGWIALGIAVTAVALAAAGRQRLRDLPPLLALGAAAVPAWLSLRFIPLHTWVSWIPPEVQQDYGTEYASIVFTEVQVPWQVASVALSVLACVLLVIGARGGADAPKLDSEEQVGS